MRTIAAAILSLLGMAAIACGSTPPLPTYTPLPTLTPAATYTPLPTHTPAATYTPPAPLSTLVPLATHTPLPTLAPLATHTPLPTLTPAATYTPLPTLVPLATHTPLPTLTPAATYTPLPTYTPFPTPTPTPSTQRQFRSTEVATTQLGAVMNDPESLQGYTLFSTSSQNGTIYLIDNDGRVVRTWEVAPRGGLGKLMENGDLLVMKTVEGFDGISRLAPDGSVVWNYQLDGQHHDFLQMPNGNIMILARELKTPEEAAAAGANPACLREAGLVVDFLVEVRPTGPTEGEIVWRWEVWDHLIQDFDPSKANYGVVSEHPELIDINFRQCEAHLWYPIDRGRPADWIHANSISHHPELDQILISARNLGEVWIIDHSVTSEETAGRTGGQAGKGGGLLYRWGNPQAYRAGSPADQQLFWAHDAQWIEPGLPGAGNIIIFNNGLDYPDANRAYSSIDEFTPPVDGFDYRLEPKEAGSAYGPAQPAWRYVGDPTSDFYSPIQSGVQRLPNGNTLICSSTTGTLFEVTPEGKTVWKYVNPVIFPFAGESPLRQGDPMPIRRIEADGGVFWQNLVYRANRYPPDHPGLRALDLTPGDPIERYE